MPSRSRRRPLSRSWSQTGLSHSNSSSPPQMSLTRTSSRPWPERMRSTSAFTWACSRWSVGTAMAAACVGDEVGGLLDRLRAPVLGLLGAGGAAGDVDGRARCAELGRDPPPRPAGRSGRRVPPNLRAVYKQAFGYYCTNMPRPKTRSDEDVLDAAMALLRDGRLTFAALAVETSGLSVNPWCSASGTRTSCANGHYSARGITSTRARPSSPRSRSTRSSSSSDCRVSTTRSSSTPRTWRSCARTCAIRCCGRAAQRGSSSSSPRSTRAAAPVRGLAARRALARRGHVVGVPADERLDKHLRESLGLLVKLLPASG